MSTQVKALWVLIAETLGNQALTRKLQRNSFSTVFSPISYNFFIERRSYNYSKLSHLKYCTDFPAHVHRNSYFVNNWINLTSPHKAEDFC